MAKKAAKKKYATPEWLVRAMQGVTFWVGHRRSLYHRYPLGESALIAEFCNLIFANIGNDLRLECEVAHRSMFKITRGMQVTANTRTDIAIFDATAVDAPPTYVFEVKRASAPVAQINSDIRRLLDVKKALPETATFLVVVSEARRPAKYVDDEGKSIRGKRVIQGKEGTFRVRRTVKAASAYGNKDTAHYVCLLEVE